MKFLSAVLTLSAISLSAYVAKDKNGKPLPYDYDLFSKDKECEYVEAEVLLFTMLNNQAVGGLMGAPASQYDPGVDTKIINMDWHWRPGFRITAGYFNAPKYWEVLATYTWYQDNGSQRVLTPGTGAQQYLKVGGYLPSAAGSSSSYTLTANPVIDIDAHSKLYYDDISTLCCRNFYPNPHLRFRIIGGLTGMWTHQRTDIVNTFQNIAATLNNRMHSKFWGIGFKLGTDLDWYWGKDFYLTGKVYWAITTGRWNTNTKVNLSDGTLLTNPHDANYIVTQNFQFIFGPSYQKSYKKTRLEIFLGYEFNSWLDVLRSYTYQSSTAPQSWVYPQVVAQDLTLTGINLRFTLDF